MESIIGKKINPKYIENPFSIEEYKGFINEILIPNSDLFELYSQKNTIKAIEISKSIISNTLDYTLVSELELKLKRTKFEKIILIAEPWSVETAQILSTLDLLSIKSNNKISVGIFLKSNSEELISSLENPNIQIPTLLFLDKKNEIKHIWGPRSNNANIFYNKLKQEEQDKFEFFKKMQNWYEIDKAQSFQYDIFEIITTIFNNKQIVIKEDKREFLISI